MCRDVNILKIAQTEESRGRYLKILHFAVDVSQKALSPLSLDERNATLLQEHRDYTFEKSGQNVALEEMSAMLRLLMAPHFEDLYFGIQVKNNKVS